CAALEPVHVQRHAASWRGTGGRAVSAQLVLPHLQRACRDQPDDALDLHAGSTGRLPLCAKEWLEYSWSSTDQYRLAILRLPYLSNRPYQHTAHGGPAALVALGCRWIWSKRKTESRRAAGRDSGASGVRRSS